MACISPVKKYSDVVKKLITSNQAYTHFDNIALLMMNNDMLNSEQKKTAIFYIANIFQGLDGVNSKNYIPGISKNILNSSDLYSNTDEFLKTVDGLLKEISFVSELEIARQKEMYDFLSPEYKRMIDLYRLKGYSNGKINRKLKTLVITIPNGGKILTKYEAEDILRNKSLSTSLEKIQAEVYLKIGMPFEVITRMVHEGYLDKFNVNFTETDRVIKRIYDRVMDEETIEPVVVEKELTPKQKTNSILKELSDPQNTIGLNKLYKDIDSILAITKGLDFKTEEARQDYITLVKSNLHDIVRKKFSVSSQIIENIDYKFSDIIDTATKYVDINELESLNNKGSEVLITFNDNTSVPGTVDADGNLFGVDNVKINKSNVHSYKPLRRENPAKFLPGGNVTIKPDAVDSGFTFVALKKEDANKLTEVLNSISSDASVIKITAVATTGFANDRIKQMYQEIEQTQGNEVLANRTLETFENQSQIRLLQSKTNAKILAVRRPVEEDGFVLMGEIPGTNIKFNMFNLDLYTVVDSNNNTTALDLTNKEHLVLFREMMLINQNSGGVFTPLTDKEFNKLVKAFIKYKSFKEKVLKELGVNPTLDVTELFKEEYHIADRKTTTSMTIFDFIENNPNAYTTVTVVTLNKKGDVIDENPDYKLVVNYKRSWNKNTNSFEYDHQPLLKSNQRIKISDTEGNTTNIPESAFVANYLIGSSVKGKTPEKTLDGIFKVETEKFKQKGEYDPNTNSYTTSFIVKFNDDGSMHYYVSGYVQPLFNAEYFVDFLNSMSNLQVEYNKTTTKKAKAYLVKEFDKLRGFSLYNTKTNSNPLMIANIASNFNGDKIVLEIRAGFKDSNRLLNDYFKDSKSKFNIDLSDLFNTVNKTLSNIKNDGKLNVIKEAYPHLKADKYNDDMVLFSEIVSLANKPDATKEIKSFVNALNKTSEMYASKLSDLVEKTVVKNFTDVINHESEQSKGTDNPVEPKDTPLMKILRQHYYFENKGEELKDFNFGRLVTKDRGSKKILSNNTPNKIDYRNSLKSIIIPDYSRKNTVISPKDNSTNTSRSVSDPSYKIEKKDGSVTPVQDIVPNSGTNEIIQKDSTKSGSAQSSTNKTFKPKRRPKGNTRLSVEDTYEPATNKDIESEIDWLHSALPQFGLENSNLADILDLANIDGAVLGLYKNKVIHLNNNIKSKGTVYHEAFHAVFRNILDTSSRVKLLETIQNTEKYKNAFTEASLKEFARKENRQYIEKEIKDIVAEEILAKGFKSYMLKNSKPKGLLQRFFEMLQRMLSMFTDRSNYIDNIYRNISNGTYSKSAIKSGVYEGQHALESIPGLVSHYEHNGELYSPHTELSSAHQELITNKMVSLMLKDDTNDSSEDKFDRAAEEMLNIYNIDKYVAEAGEEHREAITNKEIEFVSQLRFVLGARRNEKLYGLTYDLNFTGKKEHANYYDYNVIKLYDGKEFDNENGEESTKILKKNVVRRFNSIMSAGIETEDETSFILSEENIGIIKEEDTELGTVDNSFGDGVGQENLSSSVVYVRKFLYTIDSNQYNKELGYTTERVVDGYETFNAMLKTLADVGTENIIPGIKQTAQKYREDGFEKQANDLDAVYNAIVEATGMDENGNPSKNEHILYTFIDVLNVVELDNTMITLILPDPAKDGMAGMAIPKKQLHDVFIQDSILLADELDLKNEMVNSMITSFKDNKAAKKTEHSLAAHELSKSKGGLLKDVYNSTETKNIGFKDEETKTLEIYTTKATALHDAMKNIGLELPISLIKMSLLGIDVIENNQIITNEQVKEFYDSNKNFIDEGNYLEKDFFRSLDAMINTMYHENESGDFTKIASGRTFDSLMEEDKNVSAMNKDRFIKIYRKNTPYIVKFNPNKISPVIKNAEGKSIFRYARKNPLSEEVNSLRRKGLMKTLEKDPYAHQGLIEFMKDNPIFDDLLEGKDTQEAKEARLFLENVKISLHGGIKNYVGSTSRKGSTFKNMDSNALYLSHIATFLDKKTIENEDVSLQTFKRQFSQIESTDTNWLIDAIFKPTIDKKTGLSKSKLGNNDIKSGAKTFKNDYLGIVGDLTKIAHQEYNRIKREYNKENREKRASDFKEGIENKNVLDYNAKRNPDGSINVDDITLRAYVFGSSGMINFWDKSKTTDVNNPVLEVKNLLEEAARSGIEFENVDSTVMDALYLQLHKYAEDMFDAHMKKMIKFGIIQEHVVSKKVNNVESTSVHYTSKLIPNRIKNDNDKSQTILDVYPKYLNNPLDSGVRSLVFDAFMNYWKNALSVNQIFDGDLAMSVKNDIDYIKRLKKLAAAGSNFKEGTHSVSYVNLIGGYVHNDHKQYGPYMSAKEIIEDPLLTDDNIRNEIVKGFTADSNNNLNPEKGYKNTGTIWELFDGQSISSIMHQMMQYRSMGKLNSRAKFLLIKKHYSPLTEEEINELQKLGVVNNSKKTVTVGRYTYHKLSEYFIDRNDASALIFPRFEGETNKEYNNRRNDKLEEIHNLYAGVFELKLQIEDLKKQKVIDFDKITSLREEVRKNISDIHSNYRALPGRELLHDILNSMEYQQIDQMMDTEASKNATVYPIDIFEDRKGDHINFELSSLEVQNIVKYNQVETTSQHEDTKVGVQKKILLPANIQALIDILDSKETLSLSEKESLRQLKVFLEDYNISLKEGFDARSAYDMNVLRNEYKELDTKTLYKLIQEGLKSQGGTDEDIRRFNFTEDDVNINANLPFMRSAVEYYFFSHFSNNITDEKATGFHSFLISPIGFKIVYNKKTGDVITTDEVRKDVEKYSDKSLYGTRGLGVSIETDPVTGVKTYFTEAIIPKPAWIKTKEQEIFYMAKLNKFFASRIPTEDKRSMIVLKVVDFMDSSKLNSIIVPQYINILSGSDFDIDSLYGQVVATYIDGIDQMRIYGDYSDFESPEDGEYLEYIHYMARTKALSYNVKKAKEEIAELDIEDGANLPAISSEIEEMYDILGYTQDDVNRLVNYEELLKRSEQLDKVIEKNTNHITELEKKIGEVDAAIEIDATKKLIREKRLLKSEISKYYRTELVNEVKSFGSSVKEQITTSKKLFKILTTYTPIFKALELANVPVGKQAFLQSEEYRNIVNPKFQNKTLNSSIGILSNEFVFNNLYINQESSNEAFIKILTDLGTTINDLVKYGDIHTIDSVIEFKMTNSLSKDGISIAASINKFLGVASTFDLQIKKENVIWSFVNSKGEKVFKDKFQEYNEDTQTAIALIGSLLGVFTDGAKKPIPAALQLNDVNINTAIIMLGLGLDPTFVMGFNFMSPIRDAINAVRESNKTISDDLSETPVYFTNELNKQLYKIHNTNPGAFDELVSNNIVSDLYDPEAKPTIGKFKINTDNLTIDFKPLGGKKVLDVAALHNNTLTIGELGYTVKPTTGDSLSEDAQTIVLIKLYQDQVTQSEDIRKTGAITSTLKKLNPVINSFDRLDNDVDIASSKESIFTEDSISRLFLGDNIYRNGMLLLRDIGKQLSLIFVERSNAYSLTTNAFKQSTKNPKIIGDSMTGTISLKSFQNKLKNRKGDTELEKDFITKDNNNLREVFDPNYLFTNELYDEINELRETYPDNEFLAALRKEINNEVTAYVEVDGKQQIKPEIIIRMMNKLKIQSDYGKSVKSGVTELYDKGLEGRLFVRKLFYSELARTGFQYKEGGFINILPAELLSEASETLNTFLKTLKELNTLRKHGDKWIINDVEFESYDAGIKYRVDNKHTFENKEGVLADILGEDYSTAMNDIKFNIGMSIAEDTENSKIRKPFSTMFSMNIETLDFAGTPLYYAIKNTKGYDKLDDEQMKYALRSFVLSTIGLDDTVVVKYKGAKQLNINEVIRVNVPGDELTFTFPTSMSVITSELVKLYNFRSEYDIETKQRLVEFPIMYSINNSTYLLETVDGNKITMNQSLTKYDSYNGGNAVYKKLPTEFFKSKKSHVSLSEHQIDNYIQNMNKKSVINKIDFENYIASDIEAMNNDNLISTFGITFLNEEGEVCALHGGKPTSLTKGSTWSLVKDLKGKPSHSGGGVQLSIGENGGVHFSKGDSPIHAKHGLLIAQDGTSNPTGGDDEETKDKGTLISAHKLDEQERPIVYNTTDDVYASDDVSYQNVLDPVEIPAVQPLYGRFADIYKEALLKELIVDDKPWVSKQAYVDSHINNPKSHKHIIAAINPEGYEKLLWEEAEGFVSDINSNAKKFGYIYANQNSEDADERWKANELFERDFGYWGDNKEEYGIPGSIHNYLYETDKEYHDKEFQKQWDENEQWHKDHPGETRATLKQNAQVNPNSAFMYSNLNSNPELANSQIEYTNEVINTVMSYAKVLGVLKLKGLGNISGSIKKAKEYVSAFTSVEGLIGEGTKAFLNKLGKEAANASIKTLTKVAKPELKKLVKNTMSDNASYSNDVGVSDITTNPISMKHGGLVKAQDGLLKVPKGDENLTYALYQQQTGKPWATAKTEGLTTGTYEDNIKLRNQILESLSERDMTDIDEAEIAAIKEQKVVAKEAVVIDDELKTPVTTEKEIKEVVDIPVAVKKKEETVSTDIPIGVAKPEEVLNTPIDSPIDKIVDSRYSGVTNIFPEASSPKPVKKRKLISDPSNDYVADGSEMPVVSTYQKEKQVILDNEKIASPSDYITDGSEMPTVLPSASTKQTEQTQETVDKIQKEDRIIDPRYSGASSPNSLGTKKRKLKTKTKLSSTVGEDVRIKDDRYPGFTNPNTFSNKPKTKKDDIPFKTWVKDVNPDFIGPDYDLEAAYNGLPKDMLNAWKKDPSKNHLTDAYKTPNHITFSVESKNSNDKTKGGTWSFDEKQQKDVFTPSKYNLSVHSAEEYTALEKSEGIIIKIKDNNSTLKAGDTNKAIIKVKTDEPKKVAEYIEKKILSNEQEKTISRKEAFSEENLNFVREIYTKNKITNPYYFIVDKPTQSIFKINVKDGTRTLMGKVGIGSKIGDRNTNKGKGGGSLQTQAGWVRINRESAFPKRSKDYGDEFNGFEALLKDGTWSSVPTGIHGTMNKDEGRVSHGCTRLSCELEKELAPYLTKGTMIFYTSDEENLDIADKN